jgi:hypothetical protein
VIYQEDTEKKKILPVTSIKTIVYIRNKQKSKNRQERKIKITKKWINTLKYESLKVTITKIKMKSIN